MKKEDYTIQEQYRSCNLNHRFSDPIGSSIGACNLNGTVDSLMTAGNTNGKKQRPGTGLRIDIITTLLFLQIQHTYINTLLLKTLTI
jgi:hypothetical protein